ncbi:hypothetical protein F5Y16DRAFT_383239 [Xylariaceae sp. FL0255]|nr:hypothetical protein F5Y16DRAFT_383239 [Xylariaceae sp. FL0255]
MSLKRAADGDSVLYTQPKRQKPVKTDPNSGLRTMFGDLDTATTGPAGDSDLECEDDSEALAYLKAVRNQAATIPHVIVAKKPTCSPYKEHENNTDEDDDDDYADLDIYENGMGDFRGYYQDGAYTAYPDGHWEDDEDDEMDQDQQYDDDDDDGISDPDRPYNSSANEIKNAYFQSITTRYLSLRNVLRSRPPNSALDALPASNPTEAEDTTEWEHHLRETDPLPAQIAAMHKDSILRLLHLILSDSFLRKGHHLLERTSRWIWALLARLPDQGELNYVEIGCIRELGKRAVLMMVSLDEFDVLREQYDVPGSSPEPRGVAYSVDIDECYDEDGNANHGRSPSETSGGDSKRNIRQIASPPNPKGAATRPSTNGKVTQAPEPRVEPDDHLDVEMQLDSDEEEDGEVADTNPPSPRSDPPADIETAKARLLAQLNNDSGSSGKAAADDYPGESNGIVPCESHDKPKDREDEEEGEIKDDANPRNLERSQVNERATLNMILTVAGEFYGQRDLLEFRDPFGGLQFE